MWQYGEVIRVISGDTIDVRLLDGKIERVRYVGITAPSQDEPEYLQATEANRKLLNTGIVFLGRDVSDRDGYGRLLRYAISGDRSLHHELVASGWARVTATPPDTRCANELIAIQKEAYAFRRGLWSGIAR